MNSLCAEALAGALRLVRREALQVGLVDRDLAAEADRALGAAEELWRGERDQR